MRKVNSFDELKVLADELKPNLSLRKNYSKENVLRRELLVCCDTGCTSSNSLEIVSELENEIKKSGIQDKVSVRLTGCFGFCAQGPIVKVYPDNVFYVKVEPSDAEKIVQSHLIRNTVVEELLYEEESLSKKLKSKKKCLSTKTVTYSFKNCGLIDPDSIEEYIANDGYLALGKCLTSLTPQEVIAEVKLLAFVVEVVQVSLLALNGKLFKNPAGPTDKKFVVCNADEGDPGAFMDRSVLEGDPHSVLEAMAICGYAIGSDTGYIYIRAEYPKSIERLKVAIAQAEKYGLLGENILGTGFNFKLELKYGAGAFVCGEGTALMHSIEGRRGEPRMKTYSSSKSGLWKSPTCLNNVETFANIPAIILKGGDWFANLGTEDSSGTKVFALGGKVENVGLVEVPMGTTLRDIVFEIGGESLKVRNLRLFKQVDHLVDVYQLNI